MEPVSLVAAGNVLLAGSWLWLSRLTLVWLARCFTDASARTNAILLAIAFLILLARARISLRLRAILFAEPRAGFFPLSLFVLCALGQAMKGVLLDSNILASASFVVGTHALAGMYLPRTYWRRGWIVVLVALALLPLGPHIDAFLGFPTRVATAQLVQKLLRSSGVMVESAEAILIFENGAANIDLPCSGVKGLWVGGVFFLALTWLEKRELGWRWLAAGLAFLASLATANFLRVLLLVILGFACGQPSLAALVHLPLGVFGFVVACGLAVVLVRRLPVDRVDRIVGGASGRPFCAFALIGLLVFLGTLGTGVPHARAMGPTEIQLPKAWALTSLPFENKESSLFERHEALQAGKWRFHVGQTRGTLIIVVAESFRAHHAPEVCLASAGRRIDGVRREFLGPGVPIKFIDSDGNRATTATWFQSASSTTDSLMRRTLAEFVDGERRWALVSVLFDQPTILDAPTSSLLLHLHAAIERSMGNRKGS